MQTIFVRLPYGRGRNEDISPLQSTASLVPGESSARTFNFCKSNKIRNKMKNPVGEMLDLEFTSMDKANVIMKESFWQMMKVELKMECRRILGRKWKRVVGNRFWFVVFSSSIRFM